MIVHGDQLDAASAAFDGFERDADAVLMMEVIEEASYVPQHKTRLALFFSAMRHFRDDLDEKGFRVHYAALEDPNNRGDFASEIARWANKTRPEKLVVVEPGDHRVRELDRAAARETGVELEIREDLHFIASHSDFDEFAEGRQNLVMEYFYRPLRKRTGYLMEGEGPAGGEWNYDSENRDSFGKDGPGDIKAPRRFRTDDVTDGVLRMVSDRFADSPGKLDAFDYPVTREQARQALRDFVEHRLADFGRYQDAIAVGHPYLYHSRLSAVLNLHLLDPREAIEAAIDAYEDGDAPLNSVEGFVRQILGWREYVRGIYWREMPDYLDRNALDAELEMPEFMWTGDTEMNCVRDSVGQLVEHAYAHHIQRLMVLGLFAMLLGVRPRAVHDWHMSMYADAVDWVSAPNVIGMSQYGDGGLVGSKPYAASGNYIDKMSDYCAGCRYNPKNATGDDACPFTTLYWDFLSRNRNRLKGNRRMGFQFKNLDRKDDGERRAIRRAADEVKSRFA